MSEEAELVERLRSIRYGQAVSTEWLVKVASDAVAELEQREAKLYRLRKALDALALDRDPSEWADELWHARAELEAKHDGG